MTRLCLTAALVVTAALALPAQVRNRDGDFGRADWCADTSRGRFGPSRSATYCEIREATLSGQRTIDVDAGSNGGIAVRGWDSADAHVRARISAYAPTDAEARAIVGQVVLTTTGGRVRAEGPQMQRDASWAASFEVMAPRNVSLTLNASNGGLSIAAFTGTADMRTINGGVTVADAAGDIKARTQNGGVTADLTGPSWNGRGLDLETTNGGVTVIVPADYSAELETGTVNGGLRLDLPVTVTGRLTQRIRTRLGAGGPTVRAVTTNGGVNVRTR
jgi:DUF4097 and DUF4098 domain-containing protein YvlB